MVPSLPVLLIGAIPLYAGLFILGCKIFKVRRWIRTNGQIVDLIRVGDEGNQGPVFSFIGPGGRTYTVESSVGTWWRRYSIGDAVYVRYPPDDPEQALIDDFLHLWAGEYAFVFAGAVLSAIVIAWLHVAPGIPEFIRAKASGG